VPYGTIYPGWDFEVEIDAADRNGKVLRNAFIEYNEFKPWVRMRFGQQKPYYSEEFWTSSSVIDTPDRAKAVTSLSAERDIGLNLLGEAADGRVKYGIGIFNGSGINSLENNDGKDVAGRVTLVPFKGLGALVDNLQIGAGAWTGPRPDGDAERYAGILVYKLGKLKVQGEYLLQNIGAYDSADEDGVVAPVAGKKGDGWYTLATYDITIKNDFMVQPVVKYESYDPDTNESNNKETAATVGATVFFNKYCKLMLDYMFKDDDSKVANNMGIAQLQVKF
jgi:phosphate-selective porin